MRCIGFDVDEMGRVRESPNPRYINRFPLIEWGWDRDDCIAAIKRAGIPQPGKSACFFCPSTKAHEIKQVAEQYPDLIARALRMEEKAQENLTSVIGLGRSFRWRDVLATDDMFGFSVAAPCECVDG